MDRQKNVNQQAFFALLRAGLWEKEVRLLPYVKVDLNAVFQLASVQSVVGLVGAGMEHVIDTKILKKDAAPFVGQVICLEQRNAKMNRFIGELARSLQDIGLNPLLIKGQGIAQYYSRPQWRASGDVDFLLDRSSYEMAKVFIDRISLSDAKENLETLEYCTTVDSWTVELHGSLHCRLTKRLDAFLDGIQEECCGRGHVRMWDNDGIQVLLPSADDDVIVVFTHIVKHYFREGVGLRQVCDWCRQMWMVRDVLDKALLERRLREACLVTEWKAFAALAVDWLGMPKEAIPLYSKSSHWHRKAALIMDFILETGAFGQNRDFGYQRKYPYVFRKCISLCRHTWDLLRQFFVFPLDALRVWGSMVRIGMKAVMKK